MYICLCKGIRESEFEEIVSRHEGDAQCVQRSMGLDESCCGRCEANLEDLILDLGMARCTQA